MSRMAVTPCCGIVNEPSSKVHRADFRTSLRLGICPLCKLDLAGQPNGDTVEQARAKLWFRINAYAPAHGSFIWQWSDDECLLWREVMAEFPDEQVELDQSKWVALEPYTGSLAVMVPMDDRESALDIKRINGWYNDVGTWRVPLSFCHDVVPDDVNGSSALDDLIEKLRARGYRILPSVALAEKYRVRWVA